MAEELSWEWIAAGTGLLLALLGGVFGLFQSIKHTGGPQEKTFVIKMTLLTLVLVLLMLTGLFYLPRPYNQGMWLMLIPVILLIQKWNKQQLIIANSEQKRHSD